MCISQYMRVKYKPERGRYDAAGRSRRHTRTAAWRDATSHWLVQEPVTSPDPRPQPCPRVVTTNNFKFLFMFYATTVAAVKERAHYTPVFRVILSKCAHY